MKPRTSRRFGRKVAALVTAAVAAGLVGTAGLGPVSVAHAVGVPGPLINYVNNFIGTLNNGNTYPGAAMPFGMVQFSPNNGHGMGYAYNNANLRGITMTNLSGVGCSIAGNTPHLARVGKPTNTAINNAGWQVALTTPLHSAENEEAHPGYYRVRSGAGANIVQTEATATTRTGVGRYTFPASAGTNAHVLINAGYALSGTITTSSATIVDDRTVLTQTTLSGFCQATESFTIHTKTVFNRPFEASSTTWAGATIPTAVQLTNTAQRTGADLVFDVTSDQTVVSQTSMSYVDANGADLNLTAESVNGNFNAAQTAAEVAWENRLHTIEITSTDTDQIRQFYSALYRGMLAPNISDDVDGRFRGWGMGRGNIHNLSDPDVGLNHYYQNFSLWDTYRTQEQFVALVAPLEARDQVKSLVLHGEYGGWAPRWTWGPVETNIMTGDPVTAFLSSAYDQGLLEGAWGERAYQMLKPSLDGIPPAGSKYNGRQGNPHYIPYGVVPLWTAAPREAGDWDYDHGPSATLEYTLSDAMFSRMAAKLGHTEDAVRYAKRGQNYKAMWDTTLRHTYANDNVTVQGGFHPRNLDGSFHTNRSLVTSTTRFHEGTEPQYEFITTHDIPGLIAMMGGRDNAIARADHLFRYAELVVDPENTATCGWVGRCTGGSMDYYSTGFYNPNNEPDINFPFIYSWLGQPWKTADIVHAAKYLFPPTPNGMTGNDDLGTMSGWQVLTSIGLFPMAPGADIWGVTTPAFTEVDVKLDQAFYTQSSGRLQIRAPQLTDSVHYVQTFNFNGTNLDRSYLTGSELFQGAGNINYTIGATPSAWATGPNGNPGAIVPDPGAHESRISVNPTGIRLSPGETATIHTDFLIQGDGQVTGALNLPAGSPLKLDSSTFTVTAQPNGLLGHHDVPITVTVSAKAAPGVYTITTPSWGAERTVATVAVSDGAAWQQPAATRRSIAPPSSGAADADGAGHYLLDTLLSAGGVIPGAQTAVPANPNLKYTIPAASATVNDTIVPSGQTVTLPTDLQGVTQISLIGFTAQTTGTAPSMTVVARYSDGTTQNLNTGSLGNWNSTSGTRLVVRAEQRGNGNAVEVQSTAVFYTTPSNLTVPAGEKLVSLTFPTAAAVRILGIATNGTPSYLSPTFTAAITGTAKVGQTLSGPIASWAEPGVTTAYQWYRDEVAIPSATDRFYQVSVADLGTTLSVRVTGTATDYTPTNVDAPGIAVQDEPMVETVASTVSGSVLVGQTLTARPGTFNAASPVVTYQWAVNGLPVPNATGATFALTAANLGNLVTCTLTASAPNYVPLVKTITVGSVGKGTIANGTAPALYVGSAALGTNTAPRVGQTVTVNNGSLPAGSPAAAAVFYSYQWLLNGVEIAGETSSAITVRTDWLGARLTARVTTRSEGYVDRVMSSNQSAVIAVSNATITTVSPPSISGIAQVGRVLTASPGSYTNAGTPIFTYQWYREGAPIDGATDVTYTLVAADAGHGIGFRVSGSAAGYPSFVSDSAVVLVSPADLPVLQAPSLSGSPVVGQDLVASAGQYEASDVTVVYQWLRDGVAIAGAVGPAYRLTAADAGHAISAQVTANQPGYTPVVSYLGPVSVALRPLYEVEPPYLFAPSLDELVPGAVLDVSSGVYSADDVTLTYQWTVDGYLLEGATEPTLTVTEDLLGHYVACLITVTKAGYEPVITETPGIVLPQPKTTVPPPTDKPDTGDKGGSTTGPDVVAPLSRPAAVISASASKVAFGATVTVRAAFTDATGSVVLREGNAVLGSALLVNGVATLQVSSLTVGKHILIAEYSGSATKASTKTKALTVVVTKAAPSKVTVKGKAFKKGTRPVLTVKVGLLPSGQYAVGKVKVYVGKKAVKTVKLKVQAKGKLTVRLAKKYAKTIKVKATFLPTNTKSYSKKTSTKVKVKAKA